MTKTERTAGMGHNIKWWQSRCGAPIPYAPSWPTSSLACYMLAQTHAAPPMRLSGNV